MEKNKILEKIKYTGSQNPTLDSLKKLVKGFCEEIPFSTAHVTGEEIPSFGEQAAYKRVILDGQGGLCNELSIVFRFLARELGFDCNLYNMEGTEASGLVVVLGNEKYLINLAFRGVGLDEPLLIESNENIVSINYEKATWKLDLSNPVELDFWLDDWNARALNPLDDLVRHDVISILKNKEFTQYANGFIFKKNLNNKEKYDPNKHDLEKILKYKKTKKFKDEK